MLPGMSDTIVCAVADSEENAAVTRVAVKLGEKLGLGLLLVHVVPLPVPVAPTVGMVPVADVELEEDLIASGRALLAEVANAAGVPPGTEQRVEVGTAVDRILSVTEEVQAVLLVIGSHGHGAVASAILGSVSTNVAAHATCPTVVVPPRAIKTGIRL
jgi:nucleotide-binding universal stress UspA family protein